MKKRCTNISGMRFGRLVVVGTAGRLVRFNKSREAWKFICDCGSEFVDWKCLVVSGQKKSCGCLVDISRCKNLTPNNIERASKRVKNITGMKFGRLLAIEMCGRDRYGIKWKCLCDCGNEIVATSAKLRAGQVASCGCRRLEASCENIFIAQEKRRLQYACFRSRILRGMFGTPQISNRKPSVVHRIEF